MITLITRLLANEDNARTIERKLHLESFPKKIVRVYTADGHPASDLAGKLAGDGVEEATATAYAERMASDGAAMLMVRATYKPLGAARIAREILAESETLDVGDVAEETRIPEDPERNLSILSDHPRFLVLPLDPDDYRGGPISNEFGIPLLSKHREKSSVMHGGGFMSKKFWPMALLRKHSEKITAIHGGRHMSTRFWPMPLLKKHRENKSVTRDSDWSFSRLLGWPTVIRR